MKELNWTGERLVTSIGDEYFKYEHLHRYALAATLATGKVVLDIACGEGYGSAIIANAAAFVYGVDIDAVAVAHAEAKYVSLRKNISFKTGSTSAIPLEDHSVDIVVSFETIEHHDAHEQMMKEIKRVLKPDGVLLISSPNRSVYKQIAPNNPFHVKELELEEFETLLKSFFRYCSLFEQRFIAGSLITPMQKEAEGFKLYEGDYDNIHNSLTEEQYFNKAYYNLAFCSDVLNESMSFTSFFNGASVISKRTAASREKGRKEIMRSSSFKIGNWLVRKLSFLKAKQ